MTLLSLDNLHVTFNTYAGTVQAVRGVSLQLEPGEILAIVGESGSGKSVTAQAILGLLPESSTHLTANAISFDGQNLLGLGADTARRLRGQEMGIVFQDPMTSLNPTMKVGAQITEGVRYHQKIGRRAAHKIAVEALARVGITDPIACARSYPHQLSGGMRQRAVIALSLVSSPKLIIADEPTTALDVTTQTQILHLLQKVQQDTGTAIILITHDLTIVPQLCSRIAVMYAGKMVEVGTVEDVLAHPQHPYTQALLRAVPRTDRSVPLKPILGTPPDLLAPPEGCPFWPRCPHAMQICQQEPPPLDLARYHHRAACWLHHPTLKETRRI